MEKIEKPHKDAVKDALHHPHAAHHKWSFRGIVQSIYHQFIWLVYCVIKLVLVAAGFFALKIVFDVVQERLNQGSGKLRRRKKKAKAEDPEDDGDEEEQLFDVELKAINRKNQPMSGNYSDDEESSPFRERSDSVEGSKLELFQQND